MTVVPIQVLGALVQAFGCVLLVAVVARQACIIRRLRSAEKNAEARASSYERHYRIATMEANTWRDACRNFEAAYNEQLRQSASKARFQPFVYSPASLSPAEQAVYQELIDAGRRALAKTCHPDAGGSTEKMALINDVADKVKRRNC